MLTQDEYCLANYLMDYKLHGRDLPKELPEYMWTPGVKDAEQLQQQEAEAAVTTKNDKDKKKKGK